MKQKLWHELALKNNKLKNAHAIVTVSNRTAQDVQNIFHIPQNRVHAIYLGVHEKYQPNTKPADINYLRDLHVTKPYILALSTLEPRKNLEALVLAYNKCKEKNPNIPNLVIAGGNGWKTKTVLRLVEQSKHQDSIQLLGFIKEKHKPALYRHASMFVFPSIYEGFGLPPMEAMACGTPVITSFTSSMPEVLGKAGIKINPYNIQDLRQAIEALIENPALKKHLSKKGIKRARIFSWKKTTEKILKVLDTQL